jgi:hypothetical protein
MRLKVLVTSSGHFEHASSAEVGGTILHVLVNFIGCLVRISHVLGLAVRQRGDDFLQVKFAFLNACVSFLHAATGKSCFGCCPLVDRHKISNGGIEIGADNLRATANFSVDIHIAEQLKASEIGDSISFTVEVGRVGTTISPVVCGGAHSKDVAEETRDKIILKKVERLRSCERSPKNEQLN